MQLIDGHPVYSASDLVGYVACEHRLALERAALAGKVPRPREVDVLTELLQARGDRHEQDYRASLERSGRTVVEIPDAGSSDSAGPGARRDKGAAYRAAHDATVAAMRAGADVIYQGTFFDGSWVGKADFLLRVDHAAGEEPSAFGAWHYEIADTKLARRVKASAILQVCLYVDLLTPIQGRPPDHLRIVLGGKGTPEERIRLDDVAAYYRRIRQGFEAAVGIGGAAREPQYPPVGTYPEPVEHCDVCNWARACAERRRGDDHLSRVAYAARSQRQALAAHGIGTRGALAELSPSVPVQGIEDRALGRLREQAALQVASDGAPSPHFRRLPPERDPNGDLLLARGLLALPAPSPGDLFLDLEGDPYAGEDGLDYLFGVLEPALAENDPRYLAVPLPAGAGGRGAVAPRFHAFWSRDDAGGVSEAGERRAFEQLIDLIMERLKRDPNLHVYHYAPYEPTALGRIALRYGTREDEVDHLKRRGVLIDLFHVVRQGLRVGVESYSIKKLEPLYGFSREGRLAKANESIVEFERWLGLGADGDVADRESLLHDIALYNRDDVVSTLLLRDWLEAQRSELERETGVTLPRPPAPADGRSEDREASDAALRALIDRLTDGVPEDPVARAADPDGAARWLLAQLLGFHRREAKSAWWRFHELMHMNDTQLLEERDAIAELVAEGPPERGKRSGETWTLRYPPQVHGLKAGWSYYDPNLAKAQAAASGTWDPYKATAGEVRTIDDGTGRLTLYRTASQAKLPLPTALVPVETVDIKPLAAALRRIAEWVADHGIASPAPDFRAARYLLLRRTLPPEPGVSALRQPGEGDAAAATRLARALDGHVLPVQGPPGTGKTTTGAEMIVALVRAGYTVGITANSHAVIGNLLDAVVAKAGGADVRIGQNPGHKGEPTCDAAKKVGNEMAEMLRDGRLNVVGGTAWAWAKPALADPAPAVDVLVVDEAGQMSLASVLAAASAARSIVLLGDPQQLDQPTKGTHPPGAGRSALGHILADPTGAGPGRATIPPDEGLFLERTWRMHPALTHFTSRAFYDGQLSSHPGRERQEVIARATLGGAGLRIVPVAHAGNATASTEEAEVVAGLIRELLDAGAVWRDDAGNERPMNAEDVIVVAPYNDHVKRISERLAGAGLADVHVGTVDKFQGRQKPVSIYAMGTSAPELAPRGLDFLYSTNRLNVATSRAKAVAAIVCSPELFRVTCRTPKQIRLVNALCLAAEMAEAGR